MTKLMVAIFCLGLNLLANKAAWGFSSIVGATDSLPKGVRALQLNQIDIRAPGVFNHQGQVESLGINTHIDAGSVTAALPEVKELTERLQRIDPKLKNDLSLGQFVVDPKVKGQGQVFGFGYGLTDRWMFGIGVPYFDIEVNITTQFIPSQSLKSTSHKLRQYSQDKSGENQAEARAMAALLDALPEFNEKHLQYFLTEEMGYTPLGSWKGSGFGDLQAFLHYRYLETPIFNQAIRWGLILPTGRKDDPDNLTDTGFSKEATGLTLESRNDLKLSSKFTFSGSLYYEHFLPSQKEVRLTGDLPISAEKENLSYQRGSRFEPKLGVGYELFSGFMAYAQKEWSYQTKDSYDRGDKPNFDYSQLGRNSDTRSERWLTGLSYNTVALYQRNKFFLPMKVELNHSQMTDGRLEEKIDFTNLEMQIYF